MAKCKQLTCLSFKGLSIRPGSLLVQLSLIPLLCAVLFGTGQKVPFDWEANCMPDGINGSLTMSLSLCHWYCDSLYFEIGSVPSALIKYGLLCLIV